MQIRFPWFTLYGNPRHHAPWRCYLAMLCHEFLFEPWGKLTGRDEHAYPNRWTTRYAIGSPETYPLQGLRGTYFVIGNDTDLTSVPVVDGAFLFQTNNSTVGSGAAGNVVGFYRGSVASGAWEPLTPEDMGVVQISATNVTQDVTYATVNVAPYDGGQPPNLVSHAPNAQTDWLPLVVLNSADAIHIVAAITVPSDLWDSIDVSGHILVWNPDGSELLDGNFATSYSSSGSGSINVTSTNQIIGSDLSTDGVGVISAAGGVYNVMIKATANWD